MELKEFRRVSVALNQDRDFHALAGVAYADFVGFLLRPCVVRVQLVYALVDIGSQVASCHIGRHF